MPAIPKRAFNARNLGEGKHACGGPKLAGLISKIGKKSNLHHLFKGCDSAPCTMDCNGATVKMNYNLRR